MTDTTQAERMRSGKGFIAALDQSGGSTPKALRLYGIKEDAYSSEDEMFERIHEMRSRIVSSRVFNGDRVLGTILFEKTMDGQIGGKPAADYIWHDRGVVPFLKIDKGLQDENEGVRLMKPIDNLDALLRKAVKAGIFGTKERSVIEAANRDGISKNIEQHFDLAGQVLDHDLIPIIEPEVTISIPDKAEAEDMLLDEIRKHLDKLPKGREVILKLTLPTKANLYKPLIDHPNVMRVVALSGGYSREEANEKLAQNKSMIASFSRALTEGLSVQQSDAEFDRTLDGAIQSIYDASNAD